MAESGSLTVYPGEYDASASRFRSIYDPMNPVGKGSKNQTYAQIVPTNGRRVESYVYWPFDLSAIPENATIDSVSCSVAARMSSVSGTSILTAPIQLFAGSVAKGSATDVYSSMSTDPFSLSTGTWTRAELKTCRLKTGITRNTSNTSSTTYKLYFYGADLTVTYTYQSEKFMLKLGGAWHDIARVFKKVSGIWVEQTELANVVDQAKRLVNGGYWGNVYIDFTVDGTSCRAVEGMTWSEWLGSEYNTIGFREYKGLVLSPSSRQLFYSSSMSSQNVNSADVILAGNPYSTTRTG